MSITIYASDLNARVRLEKLLTKHRVERAELTAAGIPAHRVEALYPLDFERMVRLAGERFANRGMSHLNATAIPKGEWGKIADLSYKLLRDMDQEQGAAYSAAWRAHYGPDAAKLKFYQLTHAGLLYHHYMAEANNFTGHAGQVLFMSYWLLRHPQLLAAQEARGQQLMDWTVSKLLGHAGA